MKKKQLILMVLLVFGSMVQAQEDKSSLILLFLGRFVELYGLCSNRP